MLRNSVSASAAPPLKIAYRKSLDLRAATAEPRFPSPIPPETFAVPSNKRIGTNDQKGPEDRREQPIEPHEEKAVAIRKPDAAMQLPAQYDDLLPQRRVLRLKNKFGSERRGQEGQEQADKRDHRHRR
jgi:hypothetical protein